MSKVYFIEGYHKLLELPEGVDSDWQVYNASRPMPGHICWQGSFRHGVFYSAIAPEGHEIDEFGDRDHMLKRCKELDGHLVVNVPKLEVLEYKKTMDERHEVDPDQFDYVVYCQSYFGVLRREDDVQ